MALIKGRNGRMYDTATGQRVETVEHPELRTPEQLRAARAAAQPKQPKRFDGNPFEKTIEAELKRHNHNWAYSDEGKRVLGNLRRASAEWEAEQKAKREQAEFAESVRPLVEHATGQVDAILNDPSATVEECERAQVALDAARRGERGIYVQWERERHEQLTQRLAEKLAAKQIDIDKMRSERDAIVQSALDYKPEPIPEVRQPDPPMDIPVDRSRVAITRRIPVDGGVREVTEIVDAE